jgi:hypothetical protein
MIIPKTETPEIIKEVVKYFLNFNNCFLFKITITKVRIPKTIATAYKILPIF